MKLQDPIAPYAGIVARRRRERAAADAECFRIGGRAPAPSESVGPVSVVGASDWALGPERVEVTVAYIGALGGLLADLGYDIYAVGSLPDLGDRLSFVGWVGGEESEVERDQLVALDAPGLAIGGGIDDLDAWGRIEPDDHPTSIEFVRAALHEIRRLTDGDEPNAVEEGAGLLQFLLPCGPVKAHTGWDERAMHRRETPAQVHDLVPNRTG